MQKESVCDRIAEIGTWPKSPAECRAGKLGVPRNGGVGVGIMTAGASCRPQSLRSALAKISAQSRVPNQPFAFSASTTGQWEECALLISSD
jgi:hypothetical protein